MFIVINAWATNPKSLGCSGHDTEEAALKNAMAIVNNNPSFQATTLLIVDTDTGKCKRANNLPKKIALKFIPFDEKEDEFEGGTSKKGTKKYTE